MARLTGSKIIISGSKVEHLIFNNVSMFGNPLRSAYRAKTKCRRLIDSNIGQYNDPKTGKPCKTQFITLTYAKAKGNHDLNKTNKDWNLFIKRLKYNVLNDKSYPLKYVCVPELQPKRLKNKKEKVWHYHAIFFNLPDLPKDALYSICSTSQKEVPHCVWSHGSGKRKELKDFKDPEAQKYVKSNPGAYISKYITKSMEDPQNLNKRRYLASQGLLKPHVEKDIDSEYSRDSLSGFAHEPFLDLLPDSPDYSFQSTATGGDFHYNVYNDSRLARLFQHRRKFKQ